MTDLVTGAVADIPRLYTAVAEWGACLVYIVIIARRSRWVVTAALGVAGLAALAAVQLWAGMLPLPLWIPGMLAAVAVMFALVCASSRVSLVTAGYVTARAFVLAELVASLHWQLDRFYLADAGELPRGLFLVGVYAACAVAAWFVERRHFTQGEVLIVEWRELVSAVAIAAVTFGISNLSFVTASTPFSVGIGPEIVYIRTLVDLCGFISLYVQREVRRELQARRDADAMAQLIRSQHDQYEISRRAIDEVNRTYHDMKHHLDALRAESDSGTRERMLDELAESIQGYGDQVRTGNRIVDAVLTAKRASARDDGIEVAYVVDGALLDFMRPLDVTAVLGNAVDNALEGARSVRDPDGRVVRVALFAQDDFVMLRVENSFDGVIRRSGGRIVSRKSGSGHGYGLRNIEAAAAAYGGTMSVTHDAQWFSLHVLLPRPEHG